MKLLHQQSVFDNVLCNFFQISELFQTYDSVGRKMLSKLLNLEKALVLSPIQSSKEMIEIHKHFTLKGLKHTFDEMYRLQAEIKAMVSSLPDGKFSL